MKPAKRSSVRQATGTPSQPAARRRSSPRGSTTASASTTPKPAKAGRFLQLPSRRKGVRKTARVAIPPILLEGDNPGAPSPLQPLRSSIEKIPEGVALGSALPLPQAYGTQRLKLTPRDPHWIHAHWDFTREQLNHSHARSVDGHLVLRLFQDSTAGALVSETPVHRESVRWFMHAPRPDAAYAAELGFYNPQRQWSALAASEPVRTPPAAPSPQRGFELATLTPDGTLERHPTIKEIKMPDAPRIGDSAWGGLAPGFPASGGLNSLQLAAGFYEGAALSPSSPGVASWSSVDIPSSFSSPRGAPGRPEFWLKVNAELIVYGATEPDATLRIGDQIIPLHVDGSFHFRFALPDGAHALPVQAIAAGTGDQRSANLRFTLHTETSGGVGAAAPEPDLRPPSAENL